MNVSENTKKRFSLSILNNAVSVSMDRRPKSQTENSRRMHLHLPDRAINLTWRFTCLLHFVKRTKHQNEMWHSGNAVWQYAPGFVFEIELHQLHPFPESHRLQAYIIFLPKGFLGALHELRMEWGSDRECQVVLIPHNLCSQLDSGFRAWINNSSSSYEVHVPTWAPSPLARKPV